MKIVQFGLLLAALIIGNGVAAVSSNADQAGLTTEPNAARLAETELIPDVRVIIDISGSMKQNDPNNLRRPALELLVKLLPDGAKAGVWTFGQWVNNLVPSGIVDSQWRDNAFAKAASINSVALRTNIPDALVRAVDDINSLDPAYQVHVILLTDGMVDVSASSADNLQARQRIIEQIMPAMRDAGVSLHTVALSQNADQQLMELLATETNGLAAIAVTAEDLTGIFLQAFDAAVAAEQVPLEGNTFSVDASIDEFTALVFRQPGTAAASLLTPDGKTYSEARHPQQFSWFSQPQYDLVTVKKPRPGVWSINAQLQPGSRVTIVSDLGLNVSGLTKSLFTGNAIELVAALNEDGSIITRPEFLNLVDMSVQVLRRDDGQQWQQSLSELNPIPDDGVFSEQLELFQQPGVYDVIVDASAKTFQRQYKQTMAVRERYEVRVATLAGEPPAYKVTVRARNSAIDGATTTVSGQLNLPGGGSQAFETVALGNRRWVADLAGLSQSGVYQLTFTVNGMLKSGERFTEQTTAVSIEHRVAGSPFIELKAETVAEPPAEPEPEIASEPELAAPPEIVQPPDLVVETAEESNVFLYVGLAVGNLIVFALAFFAYRMVTSNNKVDVLEEDAEDSGAVAEVTVEEPPAESESLAEEPVAPETDSDSPPEEPVPVAESDDEFEIDLPAEPEQPLALDVELEPELEQPLDLDVEIEPELEQPLDLDVEIEPELEQPLDLDVEIEPQVDLDILEDEVLVEQDLAEQEMIKDTQPQDEPELLDEVQQAEEPQLDLDDEFDLDLPDSDEDEDSEPVKSTQS